MVKHWQCQTQGLGSQALSHLGNRTRRLSVFCPPASGAVLPHTLQMTVPLGSSCTLLWLLLCSAEAWCVPPFLPSRSMLPPPPEKALEPQACVSPKSVTSSSRKCQHCLSTSSASWSLFRFRLLSLFDLEADSRMVALASPFLLLLLSLWPGSLIHPQKWLPPLLCPSPGLVQPTSMVAGSHPALLVWLLAYTLHTPAQLAFRSPRDL